MSLAADMDEPEAGSGVPSCVDKARLASVFCKLCRSKSCDLNKGLTEIYAHTKIFIMCDMELIWEPILQVVFETANFKC